MSFPHFFWLAVILAVTNSGPVIPPDQLSRLFQPFQRLDPGRSGSGPERGGLGLGLAIVSAIAAAHGAELRAVTRAAGGLAVEVVFPPVPAGAGRPAEGHGGERERDRVATAGAPVVRLPG